MSSRREVLNLYKRLLIAQKETFKANPAVQHAAYLKTRKAFELNKELKDDSEILKQVENGNGVVYILKNHVAEAKEVKPNQYLLNIKAEMLEK